MLLYCAPVAIVRWVNMSYYEPKAVPLINTLTSAHAIMILFALANFKTTLNA